jgi:glycosyltransferase involved in cell wall biosynthesis
MKIAIIKRAVPIPGADVINTLSLAQGFFNLGHKVEVLALEEFKETLWKIKIDDVHRFFDLDYKIKIKYFKGSILFYLRNFKFIRGIINNITRFPYLHDLIHPETKVSKYCIKKKFDLVICRDTFKTAYSTIINQIPVIIDLHGYENITEMKNILNLKYNPYFKGIIALNNFIKNKLIDYGFPKKKIGIMDNAINLNRFTKINIDVRSIRRYLKLPLDKKIILYTGSISLDRGIDTILMAANLLKDESYSFYFIGSTEKYVKIWEQFIKDNNIKADINFFSVQPFRKIPYYLKAADILLATFSPNCPSLEYMSPVKMIEYMASKTPFIATKIGRNREICSNNECLFTEVDDPIDLSNKIKLLMNDETLQKRLIQNAFEKAKNHTFQIRCQLIINLFQDNYNNN